MNSIQTLIRRLKEGTFGEIIDDWRWILGYSKKYKGAILLYTFLGILSTTFGLVSSVAGKYLIDIITGYQMDKLGTLAIIMVGSAVFSLLFNSLVSRYSAKLSISIHNDIQSDIFDQIMEADWLSLNTYSYGDLLNRFNSDVGTVSGNAVSWVPSILIAIYRFAATFVVILYYDVTMALIAFAAAPFTLLISRYMMKHQREHSKQVREMSSNLMAFESEAFYNIDTIKSFGIASLYGSKMRSWQEQYKKVTLDYNRFSILSHMIMSVIGFVVQYAAFGYCLFRLWTGDITFGTMTLFLQQRNHLSQAFNQMVSIVPAFLNSSVSAHRLREVTGLPKDVPCESDWRDFKDRVLPVSVEMEKAAFAYEEGRPVFEDADFIARPGEIVALVGPSGEGKTTMIRLFLGLVKPISGRLGIKLGGETLLGVKDDPITENEPATAEEIVTGQEPATDAIVSRVEFRPNRDTRALFSYVPQGNTILSGTVAENLRMVKPEATEEELREALEAACALEFVEKMPKGLHSSVGEKGKGLSEGQAQRIAIARAILKDAPVLLLDEATSALDVATERQLLKNIMVACPNRTCIVTTHRPSVLSLCQRVYRVADRKVTEVSEEEAARMAMEF